MIILISLPDEKVIIIYINNGKDNNKNNDKL